MTHMYNDGGRSQYTSQKSDYDCAIRAIAIATGRTYRDVYQDITAVYPDHSRQGVDTNDVAFIAYMQQIGFVKVSGLTSMQAIPKGRVIAYTVGHLTAIVDGAIQDVRNESNKAVPYYWVLGERFNVLRGGRKLNSSPMNAQQAQTMLRLYTLNYNRGESLHLQAV